jgi:ribosomal peptide maturation radical SAM protein 1
MPFAAVRPAIGASLLVAHLQRIGIPAQVSYLNMAFAHALGEADYRYFADNAPTQSLAGDWVFAKELFGVRPAADTAYVEAFATRFAKYSYGISANAVLSRARNNAEVFINACLAKVDWMAFDVVGFTSSFTQNVASLALAKRLKAIHPHLRIVFGGANCEDAMGLGLHQAFAFVDFVCCGEADISFPRLVTALSGADNYHDIPGVISRQNGQSRYSSLSPEQVADLDDLPIPNFDDYFQQVAETFPQARPVRARVLMESSRGCWWGQKHHCTFCGLNGNAIDYRAKSPKRVVDELTELQRRYSAEHIEMVDNILDRNYFLTVLPEITRRNLNLRLFYETKANLRKDQMRLLREAGVMAIQPGIESLSTTVLRLIKKGTTAVQNIQMLKWCSEFGIEPCWNLLYGFPGENPAEYDAMPTIVDSVSHFEPPRGIGAFRLDRFSPYFTRSAELGLCNLRPDRSYHYIYDLPEEQLFSIACYFEHDYTDGRNPDAYAAETIAAVQRWRGGYKRGRLVYADHGDCLAIWDLRSGASQRLTILRGISRKVYLHCDEHQSLRGIQTLLDSDPPCEPELGPLLDGLVAKRLMLKLDDRYLSLAVRLADGENLSSGYPKQHEDIFF